MQHDMFFTILIGCLYAFIAWLILYQIEIRLRLYAKIKCRLGFHKRTQKELGKTVKTNRCVHCKLPKSRANLTVIQGGKKDLGSNFKW